LSRASQINSAILALILGLAAAAYRPGLRGEFLGDEYLLILNNPRVQHPGNLKSFFSEQFWPGKTKDNYYRPLIILSYALNWKLHGTNPLGYHLFNLGFHLANVLLFYLLCRRRLPAAALLATALFALHPVLTEAVAKISGRTDLMSSFFLLAGGLLWERAQDRAGLRQIVIYITIGPLMLLALLCKETGILLPALVLIGDFWSSPSSAEFRARLRRGLPGYLGLGLAAAIYFWLRHMALSGPGLLPAEVFIAGYPVWQRPLVASRIGVEYLRLLVMPRLLAPDYFYTEKFAAGNYPLRACIWSALFGAAALVFLARGLRRRNAYALLGILFLVSLLPVSHLIPFPPAMAERFLYFPSAFFALALALLILAAAKNHPRLVPVLAATLLAAFFLLTLSGSRPFRSRLRNYREAVQKVPVEKVFHNLLGAEYLERKQYDAARKQFRWALRLDPYYPEVLANLAVIEYQTGNHAAALDLFQKALAVSPDYAGAHYNLGIILFNLRRFDAAEKELEKARRLEPDDPGAPYALARIALQRGDLEQARNLLDLALGKAGWHLPSLKLRAQMALEEKAYVRARELLEGAEKIAPSDPEVKRLKAGLPR
jgi:Tfp pilus assembly protein PilF